MTTQNQEHPGPHPHRAYRHAAPGGTRRMFRFGMLATAALGAIGTAAGVAQAVTIGGGYSSDSSGIAVADNETFALSNAHDPTTFKDSFTVHQYGVVEAAAVRNEATAESVACSPSAPCRAVSLSFQIITMAGTDLHLDAVNLGNARNEHCAGCQSVAGAYQFVVDTPGAFELDASARAQLAAIHRKLDALSSSELSIADVRSQADALAVQVAGILKNAAATSPEGTTLRPQTLPGFNPAVKVYRDFHQN
ncbi:MAG TPA: hypothetical protein VH372_11305 [Actinospica sp.]|jgi:hypothetical protein|nr:hypothetical protein [Actinospica sp.]